MYCSSCGTLNEDSAAVCKTCGMPLKKIELAGYWRRYGALMVDYFILCIISIAIMAVFTAIGIFASVPAAYSSASEFSTGSILSAISVLLCDVIMLVVWILYFTLFEASHMQGTPGKIAVGMAVVDMKGNRIGPGRSLLRNLMKIVSILIVGIGFFMVGFTEKSQGLHDIVAGTTVVMKRPHYLELEPDAVKAAPEIAR